MTVEKQVAIIYCGTKGLLAKVPVDKVKNFQDDYLLLLENQHKGVLEQIRKGNIGDDVTSVLEKVAKELSAQY
jgi:F-type H+-transporting ATPase subunit alpha